MTLTAALLRYASHLYQGRITPQALDRKWITDQPRNSRDFPAELVPPSMPTAWRDTSTA